MKRAFGAAVVATMALAGCDKSSGGQTAPVTPTASATVAASASAAAAATSAAPTTSASSGPAAAAATYTGTFKTKVASVVTPKDAHIKVWGDDPGTAMLGDGSITLSVSAGSPRQTVTGTVKGVLGDQIVRGELDGKTLQARVDPKDPNAEGAMTGVLQGTSDGSTITATLRVANRNANVVREAEIKLSAAR